MDYCLACFGRSKSKDGEREPLLPKDSPRQQSSRDLSQSASSTVVNPERPVIDKIVDVLAALNAGKLPTQDQISNFLQVLLKSELLRDIQDKGKVVPGYGPLSKEGRKVLADVRALVQAALQFGMEKNADNKLQELYFQVVQMDVPPIEVNVDKPTAYRVGQTALDKTREGASELVHETPSKDEAAFDAQTFIHALRTLVETCISSFVFRFILADLVSIARDQFADTAADVEHAAHEVELTAAKLEQKARARQGNDIIAAGDPAAEGRPELDVSASVSVDDVKEKGQQVVDKIKIAGESAKREWEGVGEDVKRKAKQRTLERIQQLMARIQKDPASRSALRAILTLVHKYSERVALASEVISSTIEKTVASTQDVLIEDSTAESPQESKKPFIDITADVLLEDFKTVLERLGQGHSLDGVLLALSHVVQDLEDVPLILEDEVNEKMEEKSFESTSDLKTESEPSPTLSSPSPTPPAPQLSKSQKKKLKKKQRALDKAREAAFPLTPTSTQPEAISPSESQSDSPVVVKAHESEVVTEHSPTSAGNPFRAYFSRVSEYLDKSLEPEWGVSNEGMKTLEGLFDDGGELTHVVSESVVEVGMEMSDGSSSERTTPIGGETKTITQRHKERENEMRWKFKTDLMTLMNEVEAFIAAMENDKTTMALIRAYDTLGTDLAELLQQEAEKKIRATMSWVSWLRWAIPRILNMIPSGALPIPSLEVKTGKMEAALRPLFVRGLGRTSKLGTSLVPDEVVLQEWTEMRIDMADHEPDRPTYEGVQNPDVHTTSRVRMHMDGIRARVEGMGYYFKYKGGLVGYEDEGVLSVDAGLEGVHDGLEVDVEVKVENENVLEGQSEESVPPKVPVPEIIVQDADTSLASESSANGEANVDVMRVGANRDVVRQTAPADPLFRIMDVSVAMHGLHFKIDQSKHWIINKLLVQPLAGPLVGRLMKKALEEKVKTLLENLALGLGEVSRDARRRGDERRRRAAARALQERMGGAAMEARPLEAEAEVEMVMVKEEEGLAQVLGDWWSALLHTGPAALGRAVTEGVGADGEEVPTRTSLQATTKGVIYTSISMPSTSSSRRSPSTAGPVQHQPQKTQEMVYHPETKSFERVDMSQIQEERAQRDEAADEEEEEVVVAVGGAQLFPGKAGAPAEEDLVQGIKDNVRNLADRAGRQAREAADMVERAEERWDERTREERETMRSSPRLKAPGAWESDAFDW